MQLTFKPISTRGSMHILSIFPSVMELEESYEPSHNLANTSYPDPKSFHISTVSYILTICFNIILHFNVL
jgi:hypothetical protein